MVDNDVLLAKCPELKDMRNATEFVIACVTQNLRLLERGVEPVNEARLEENITDSVKDECGQLLQDLRAELGPIRDALLTKVSTAKGRVGENLFENWMKEIKTWATEKVATKGHSGDFEITHYDTKATVLVDVKKYSTSVPTKEQEKLWEDMQSRGIRLGLLVSMDSGIAKKRPGVDMEVRAGHVMLFLSNATDNKEWLFVCLEILRLQQSCATKFDLDAYLAPLKDVIELAKAATGDAEKLEKDLVKRLGEHRASVAERTQQIQRILKGMMES